MSASVDVDGAVGSEAVEEPEITVSDGLVGGYEACVEGSGDFWF